MTYASWVYQGMPLDVLDLIMLPLRLVHWPLLGFGDVVVVAVKLITSEKIS